MIDEWGNEIKENPFAAFKKKLLERRYLLAFLLGAAFFTLAAVQAIGFFVNRASPASTPNKAIPTISQISPRDQKKLSPLSTESGFLLLEENTATLSSQIDTIDLYESPLMFPPVNVKVSFGEK